MKKIQLPLLIIFFAILNLNVVKAQKTISFYSKDGILITADLYFINDSLPYMILCHQAGSSRGEYLETASRFTKFGYNCIAIDMRSGGEMNKIKNETAIHAKAKGRSTNYLDAAQDITSAVDYAYELSKKKVVLVGSSYSASLAMKIAVNNNDVKAVIAFSPGEYFGDQYNFKDSVKTLTKPLFVTSSKSESEKVGEIIKDISSKKKQQFTPSKSGSHGSSSLLKSNANHQEYWLALMMFMLSIK